MRCRDFVVRVASLLVVAGTTGAAPRPAELETPAAVVAPGSDLAVVLDAFGPVLVGPRRVALPLPTAARVDSVVAGAPDAWAVGATLVTAAGVEPRWIEGRGEKATPVAGPTAIVAPVLRSPRPLLLGERIGAVAWLDGDGLTRLAVRAAVRQGDGWTAPATVAPPGPGSQLALVSATLDDGSWLLVWSAFDGHDDEVLWSRYDGKAWSRPRSVADGNDVPDITPHLAAVPGGALVAWSRYDGQGYEVVVARLRGDGWSEPVAVAPRGSHFPTVEVRGDQVAVLYQRAVPSGWAVAELDRYDAVRRRAFLASDRDDRPHVVVSGDSGAVFRWDDATKADVAAWGPAER